MKIANITIKKKANYLMFFCLYSLCLPYINHTIIIITTPPHPSYNKDKLVLFEGDNWEGNR